MSCMLFTTALLAMLRARSANLSDAMLSSTESMQGATATIRLVLQLPPRLSCSKWVRRLDLGGVGVTRFVCQFVAV